MCIHPYHVANIEGEWYVLARNVRWGDIAQYALGRVTAATLSDETFTIPPEVDIPALLAERVGRLVLEPARASRSPSACASAPAWPPTSPNAPGTPSQKCVIRRRDGSVSTSSFPSTAEAAVIPWILSFGANAEVLAPRALRDRVARTLMAAGATYKGLGNARKRKKGI
jgi:predicted DNA-binding transcriptional regulator YafY